MRATAFVLLALAGCSPFFVQGPPSSPTNQYFDCTERKAAPLVDLLLAGAALAVPIYLGATPSPGCGENCGVEPAGWVAAGLVAAAFLFSADLGNRRATACAEARARFAP